MHPHPASVHFPIAYLVLGSALNVARNTRPELLTTWLPTTGLDVTELARFLQTAGLVAAIPAITTGVFDVVQMARQQGLFERDTGKLRKKARVAAFHAAATGTALAAETALWYFRGAGRLEKPWMAAVEFVAVGLLLYGAKLGGALAFEYGMGFSARKEPAKQK